MPDLMDSDGVHQIFDTCLNRFVKSLVDNLTGAWPVVKSAFQGLSNRYG